MTRKDDPKTAIHSLNIGETFRFHHDGVVCTFLGTRGCRYDWHDYQGGHYLYAPSYQGTGKTAWPFVYPVNEPETIVELPR
jgi:hypothetical protein